MYLSQPILSLISLSLLVSGSVIPRDTVDPENPEASDPKTPPSKLNRLPRPENPFKDGFKNAPSSCTDWLKPSTQCIEDLQAQPGGVNAFSGGELKWDNDHRCDEKQQGMFQTAAWDAHSLAFNADDEPDDNLKRASGFSNKKTFDIILSCRDTKSYCSIQKDGKSVGGYAWTYNGWFGYYYYITMCAPFFQTDDLMGKIDLIEKEMAEGNPQKAQEAVWQKSTGQMFLHEMMHLDSVGTPHITDEHIDPNDAQNWAYGPNRVHLLARRALNQGGGASRASTNADSYAWLANSKYFYDLTGYFPRPSNYKASDDTTDAEEQTGWTLDFGSIMENTADSDITNRMNSIVAGFGTPSSPSEPKPSTGKSLSIAMTSLVNSHGTFATVDSTWSFYTTSVGKAVGSCGETDGEKLTPQGGTSTSLSPSADIENPSWPAGEFKLNIEGESCEYKCDGTNSGRLFCPKKEIECREDTGKSKADGVLKCGSRVKFHAVVYCDF
ncbi:hypothetical protein T440DRAFT_396568 [Plenodomus tracheiphilus IPT5]|uniref:Uncharacterized protein n=1 Tax=Plenodomus tracheiphilus IPT5 TaxID=1408161 RepID=A0A6A7B5V4_9PLEO|nr:hypothetical protein T440DRAFT_396568 [Plenodomus tracheiphilus IPT5]